MTRLVAEPAPYPDDGADVFAASAHLPWAIYLDSGRPRGTTGRWDILLAQPTATLVTRAGTTEIQRRGRPAERSRADPFDLLRRALHEHRPACADLEGLPFRGGAAGYFAYDLARRIERLPSIASDDAGLPEMAVGIYDAALLIDHERHCAWQVRPASGAPPLWARRAPRERDPFVVTSPLRSNLDPASYGRAFDRVQRYITAGDCYQVNLAQRFSARVRGDGWAVYRALRERNPAPYAAYLRLPFCEVLSVSPERFLAVRGGGVETCPIKGTRPRRSDPAEDAREREALAESPKDRAENLMIVDLLRNDLGKACRPGTIAVPRLFALETHPTVHHLVSTVTGQLRPERDAIDLLRGALPGGSITGAPKLRAMQIIEELEPHRRGIYCGAVGYLGFDGDMDTSIAIRTIVLSGGEARFGVGGGIVADSEVAAEYQETLDKAAALRAMLEVGRG